MGAGGWVYILTNKPHGTLYLGVTADLERRVWEHRTGTGSRFSHRYNLSRLVWLERHEEILQAIQRETSLKRWTRAWKIALIEKDNPEWLDLLDQSRL
jgi:putative endonuclease